MRRLILAAACGLFAVMTLAGPVGARDFGAVYVDDAIYRVFGNAANVPDGTGTDPFRHLHELDQRRSARCCAVHPRLRHRPPWRPLGGVFARRGRRPVTHRR